MAILESTSGGIVHCLPPSSKSCGTDEAKAALTSSALLNPVSPCLGYTKASTHSTMPLPNMTRNFKFFVKTNGDRQIERADRLEIRRTVMTTAKDRKLEGGKESQRSAEAILKSRQSDLKQRFRVEKPGEPPKTKADRKPKKSQLKQNQEIKSESEDGLEELCNFGPTTTYAERSDQSCTSTTASTRKPSTSQSYSSSRPSSPEELSQHLIRTLWSILQFNPNLNYWFDPFDVLPIPGTAQLDRLLKLYKSGTSINSIAADARQTWRIVLHDIGLLHATLATWALYGRMVRGMTDLTVDQYKHKVEAIKHLKGEVAKNGFSQSDECVALVLILVHLEQLHGDYEEASVHMNALKDITKARGGIDSFRTNDGLIRGIVWADLHEAAVARAKPTFPRIMLDPDMQELPFPARTYFSAGPQALFLLPEGWVWVLILGRLKSLCSCFPAPVANQSGRISMSNFLYHTVYSIAQVRPGSAEQTDNESNHQPLDGGVDIIQREPDASDHASIRDALIATTQILVCIGLRDIPIKATLIGIHFGRLRAALDRPGISCIETWMASQLLPLLLWVLVVACVVLSGDEREWWMDNLVSVAEELGVRDQLDLQWRMENIAWPKRFFGGKIEGLWRDMDVCMAPNINILSIEEPYNWSNGVCQGAF
ncbi:hypothetical protein BU24DRAFT_463127 [Aaosphaeria arxii CBS 175.79]|uniref:Uncharacterized protein n=1 Tax=Aaosphaeria arxii CBS 175.79 TaxID=1450172 RepID=A0A6A5XN67_9PLEO|nr:uncharacterized protein BU24DRAFT_463127 [Aaosphaeria arxii CBS 175.79]KAF2014329.1 hypothetical protein BU24DRAFT_463127 [Aaosphaeria arxii CBS 175.79]